MSSPSTTSLVTKSPWPAPKKKKGRRRRPTKKTFWKVKCLWMLWKDNMKIKLKNLTTGILASAYVSMRQHTSACACIRQHASAYVCIRQHPWAYVCIRQHTSACVCIRQHASHWPEVQTHWPVCSHAVWRMLTTGILAPVCSNFERYRTEQNNGVLDDTTHTTQLWFSPTHSLSRERYRTE